MKGEAQFIGNFLEGMDKRFIIPAYQRNYDWTEENCEQLFDDLVKLIETGNESHFFGCMVTRTVQGGYTGEIMVVDGQQRITTIILLLLALRNLLDEKKIECSEGSNGEVLKTIIYDNFLFSKWRKFPEGMHLKPAAGQLDSLASLYKNRDFDETSNLTINYRYLANRIIESKIAADVLLDAIKRLKIVNVTLDESDEPQEVYESLNATGATLTESDKVRNFLLMGLDAETQEDYYQRYWYPIELNAGADLSLFLRDYLTYKTRNIPTIPNVYKEFKRYFKENNLETESVLKDILEASEDYYKILYAQSDNLATDKILTRLLKLGLKATYPFFLKIFEHNRNGVLNESELQEVLIVIENYIFRRMILEQPTNSLNKFFPTLDKNLFDLDGNYNNYSDKLKYYLTTRSKKLEYPKDDQFLSTLVSRNFYNKNNNLILYILERFENENSIESRDVYNGIDNKLYQIEHIMPQTLSPEWRRELGEDYEKISNIWLNRLANLTLTGYNPQYSNRSFNYKRSCKNGYYDSGFRLNRYISKFNRWSEQEMEERSEMFKKVAYSLWPYPATEYEPPESEGVETVSLDSDEMFTNCKLESYSINGKRIKCGRWVDMLTDIIFFLHNQNEEVLYTIVNDGNEEITDKMITSNDLGNTTKIDEGLYLLRGTSTRRKVSYLRKLLKEYGVPLKAIDFHIKRGK